MQEAATRPILSAFPLPPLNPVYHTFRIFPGNLRIPKNCAAWRRKTPCGKRPQSVLFYRVPENFSRTRAVFPQHILPSGHAPVMKHVGP